MACGVVNGEIGEKTLERTPSLFLPVVGEGDARLLICSILRVSND
jgi:hypothetical protein